MAAAFALFNWNAFLNASAALSVYLTCVALSKSFSLFLTFTNKSPNCKYFLSVNFPAASSVSYKEVFFAKS